MFFNISVLSVRCKTSELPKNLVTTSSLLNKIFIAAIHMPYHINESKISTALKHFLVWFSLLFMGSISVILLKAGDLKIPQHQTVITVNIKDKINICTPGEKDQ